jgi:hypothetical protein
MVALIVLVTGELVLLGVWVAHDVDAVIPFTTDVVPHYTAAIVTEMIALWAAYVASRRLHGRTLHVAIACAVIALIAGVFAYSLYHGLHAATEATAFHEQLALPFLVTLAGIAAVFVERVTLQSR